MSQFQMVPVGDGGIVVSEQMRKDAAASVANVEASGGPFLYLCNGDAEVVEVRKEAAAGDFVIMGVGEKCINLGQSPMFIVMSQHKRHDYWTGTGKDAKLVWDAARDAMTPEQAAQADLDWSDPRSAKPYDSYILLHVEQAGLDPNGVGPIRYKSSAHTAKDSNKWLSSILNYAAKGLPMFAQVWRLTGYLKDTGHGSRKYTFNHELAAQIPESNPAYPKLKASWQHAQGLLSKTKREKAGADEGPSHADRIAQANADRAAQADREAVNAVRDTFGDASTRRVEKTEYATALPDADEEVKPAQTVEYQTPPANGEPMLMDSELKLGFHWGSVFRTGADKPAVAVRDMTKSEVEAAIEYADQQPVTNTVASVASRMLTRWLKYIDAPLHGSNDGTSAPF